MANFSAWWKIGYSPNYQNGAHLELTLDDLVHIAELIKQDYTEGEIICDEESGDEET